MKQEPERMLDQAFERLENETPNRVSRAIRWLRKPEARWIRWPLGLLLIAGGIFGFLPILGVELIPIGLLLIAQDVPYLRGPVGRAALWLEHQWLRFKHWWARKKG